MTTITRTANTDGTYTYTLDGAPFLAASKAFYTHAATYEVGEAEPVTLHKTEAAANKATRPYWTKTGVMVITEA